MAQLFSMDPTKDRKLIGKMYTLKNMNQDEEGNPIPGDLRAKLVDITVERAYVFKVTTRNSELEEFSTRIPNDGDIA